MKKGYRYLIALLACAAIFVLWILCQMFVVKGVLIGVLFCSAMAGTWKAITSSGVDDSEPSTDNNIDQTKENE